MQHDLLIDPISTVFAVNCREEGSTLHCGALYLEPLVQSNSIRLAYNGATVEIELPPELVNQTTPYRAWNVELPIRDEQVRDSSLCP
jgi:hypothetical protein